MEHLDDPDLRIVDLSSIRTYQRGHIPGARHVWWQDTIEIHNQVYGMMPGRDDRAKLFAQAGIDTGSFVVVFDDEGGRQASRLLWLLHAVGFHDVALLNGGRQAWEAAGYELVSDQPETVGREIEQVINYEVLIGADDVASAIGIEETVIIDGRSSEERRETWFKRLRIGAIPGSIHLPHDQTTVDDSVPYFLSREELREMIPTHLDPETTGTVIVYGLHGVAAAHTYVVMRLLGFEHVRLYDGSWAEWGADDSRAIESTDLQ